MGLWSRIVRALSSQGSQGAPLGPVGGESNTQTQSQAVGTMEATEASAADDGRWPEDRWWAPQEATLTAPVRIERPELSNEARAIEELLLESLDGHDLSMPPLPKVPERVLRMLRDAECDWGPVADEISEDEVIAAAVLRTANSAMYGGVERITAVRPAVNRLGSKVIRVLMMHQALRAVTFRGKRGGRELARTIWCESLASAYIMAELAGFMGAGVEDAFLIGLLHDIGKVVVMRVVADEESAMDYPLDAGTFEYLCDRCHEEFGALIADAWRLSPDLRALAADHHSHPNLVDPLRSKRLMLQLTDMINSAIGYGPAGAYKILESRAAVELGLADREDFVELLSRLPEGIEEAINDA